MILNPITERWLGAFINRPVSTLLIETRGDVSAGLEIAERIHKELIKSKNHPINTLKFEEQKSIGIDDVRDIQKSMALKADNTEEISRITVIESAERLTPEAQNALLKLIEELPDKTIIILLIEQKEDMLQTIQSRCFVLPVFPITEEQSKIYANKQGYDLKEASKAYIMSEGLYSEFEQLLTDPNDSFHESINVAKKFLQSSVFERQKSLTEIQKSDSVNEFLKALSLTAKSGMRLSKTLESKKKWKNILSSTLNSQEQLKSNVNAKLVLLNLSVALP